MKPNFYEDLLALGQQQFLSKQSFLGTMLLEASKIWRPGFQEKFWSLLTTPGIIWRGVGEDEGADVEGSHQTQYGERERPFGEDGFEWFLRDVSNAKAAEQTSNMLSQINIFVGNYAL